MEITKQVSGRAETFHVKGRIDTYWSDQLASSIEDSRKLGFRHIRLNLAGVDYLSSAGIRILLKYFKQLKSDGGELSLAEPSPSAKAILEMAGLTGLIAVEAGTVASPESASGQEPRLLHQAKASYRVHEIEPEAMLKCEFTGNLAHVQNGEFGGDFHDCRERFGEFLAVGGVTMAQPSDGAGAPDCVSSDGDLVPDIQALYALSAHGPFTHYATFEAKAEPPGFVGLSEVLEALHEINLSDLLGMVMVAECAGVVGAALTKDESGDGGLSFAMRRAFERALIVAAGVVCRRELVSLQSVLGPIGLQAPPVGHFHAAVFPYRTCPAVDANPYHAINQCFNGGSPQALLHLGADRQGAAGIRETALLRGTCWIGRLKEIAVGRAV
jgi:anti-anti-sigma factor